MTTIRVNDQVQHGYEYERTAREGKDFAPDFKPDLTPKQMIKIGVFGGQYLNDCMKEFPEDWFKGAKLARGTAHDPLLNFFKVDASQSLAEWQKKGWIHADDPRGWFQWYARYYMGRRMPEEDERQIKRWKAMTRHIAQLQAGCTKGDLACHPVQRQALLHWAYDSRKL